MAERKENRSVLTIGGNPTASLKANRRVVKVPKGTSKYQAAWIVDDGEEGSEKDDDDDDEDDDFDDDMMEEAVSQVPPRADTAGDPRMLLHIPGQSCPSSLLHAGAQHRAGICLDFHCSISHVDRAASLACWIPK